MKSVLLSILSATLFVAGVSAQSLTINTPLNVVVCQPLQMSWTGGTAPYFLSVHPGATPDNPAILDFGTQTGTSFLWPKVNVTVGTSLDITLRDSTGLISQSAPFTVQTGSDLSCLNSTAAPSAPAGTTTGTTTPGATTSASTTPTTPAATTPGSSTSKSSSSSAASSTPSTGSSTKNDAAGMPVRVSYAVAGVLGAVIAAVFA